MNFKFKGRTKDNSIGVNTVNLWFIYIEGIKQGINVKMNVTKKRSLKSFVKIGSGLFLFNFMVSFLVCRFHRGTA